MRKTSAILAAALLLQVPAWADTYTFHSAPYPAAGILGFTPPCGAGACADFTAAMQQSGSFSTSAPIPANFNGDISGLVTAYAFSDGLTTYASSDPWSQLVFAVVATDATGAITGQNFALTRWQTAPPHVANDRIDVLSLGLMSYHNDICTSVQAGVCANILGGPSGTVSQALVLPGWTWSMAAGPVAAAPQSVPVDSPWALALAAAGVLGLALRRRA